MIGSADLSPCGTWRYQLQRTWNDDAPLMVFVMLNPSTADASTDDATLRACLRQARAKGFGRLRVLNLFALRATDPALLASATDPVGPHNEAALHDGLSGLHPDDRVVCAWGNGGHLRGRGLAVAGQLRARGLALHHLGLTAAGQPRHPLYVPQRQPVVRWGTA